MSYVSDGEITKDGFCYSRGRFYVRPGYVERVESSALRDMFLPRISPLGRQKLNGPNSDNFVRAQLKHYGVAFDESQISGDGSLLMKKALLIGKCDRVPDHIADLHEQMHAEWLNKSTPEQLASYPKLVLEKYFLSSSG